MVSPCYDSMALVIARANAEERRKAQGLVGNIVAGVVQAKYLEDGRVPINFIDEPERDMSWKSVVRFFGFY